MSVKQLFTISTLLFIGQVLTRRWFTTASNRKLRSPSIWPLPEKLRIKRTESDYAQLDLLPLHRKGYQFLGKD